MPEYNWRCARCDSKVLAQFEICQLCGCPSVTSTASIEQMKYVWDSNLSIRLAIDDALVKNERFKLNLSKKSHFAAQLLLYDRVVIQTNDFGIIPILEHWCGIDGLFYLLENRALLFIWQDVQVAYSGNGGGLIRMAVGEPSSGWENWLQTARWGDFDIAAQAQIDNSISNEGQQKKNKLLQLVMENSIRANQSNMAAVIKDTQLDLLSNFDLNHALHALENSDGEQISLNRLSGINSNQVRMASTSKINNSIDLYLNIADVNNDILTASSIYNCDLLMPMGTDSLLKSKIQRNRAGSVLMEDFISMLNLAEIPDIRPAIMSGKILIKDIIKLRHEKYSQKFRLWLHNNDTLDNKDLQQAYVRSLRSVENKGLPMRALTFLATKAMAGLNPFDVFGSDAVDSLIVEKFLEGYTPTLFIEEIRSLPISSYKQN